MLQNGDPRNPQDLVDAFSVFIVGILKQHNFFGCRLYVYQSKATAPVRQAIEFAAASFGFRLVEYLCFLFLTFVLNFHYLLSVSLISCIFTVLKHFVYERTIFSDSAKLGPTGSVNTTFSAAQGDK